MNKQEKIKFVEELTGNIANSIIEEMDSIPESWDGLELRWLIYEKAEPHFGLGKRRKKDYNNDVLVHNL